MFGVYLLGPHDYMFVGQQGTIMVVGIELRMY